MTLPARTPPWRIVFVDDDGGLLANLLRAAGRHRQAVDLRTWEPSPHRGLWRWLREQLREGWRPDLLVIDVNLARGGHHSLELVAELRRRRSLAALPIVLATAATLGVAHDPAWARAAGSSQNDDWPRRGRELGADGLLWEKSSDELMLRRLLENIDAWRDLARRRAWSRLIAELADMGRRDSLSLPAAARRVTNFCAAAFAPATVDMRWRSGNDQTFRLAGYHAPADDPSRAGAQHPNIQLNQVPILQTLFTPDAGAVVRNDGLSAQEAGPLLTYLAGRRFLGAGIHLGNRTYGFVTLTAPNTAPPFDPEIDCEQLTLLARLLATSLGRQETVEDLLSRQASLLAFAHQAAAAQQRTKVCQAMADLLHVSLHPRAVTERAATSQQPSKADSANGQVTCRLLNFSTGDLEPKAAAGYAKAIDKSPPIHFTDRQSVYAEVVRSGATTRLDDVRRDPRFKENNDGRTRSELCVPIRISAETIGALNLEHTAVGHYTKIDQAFAELAANTLGQVLTHLTAERFQRGALSFVDHFLAGADSGRLERELFDVLHRLCGYSVLVQLAPGQDSSDPWQARRVDIHLKLPGTTSAADLLAEVNAQLHKGWGRGPNQGQTLIERELKAERWRRQRVYYTKERSAFMPVTLAPDVEHTAESVLWLCREDGQAPYQALLLLWGLTPPMDQAQVALMDRLARLFAGVDAFRGQVDNLLQERALGQQYEMLGHVMQHFRHRLNTHSAVAGNRLRRLDKFLAAGNVDNARREAAELGRVMQLISQSYDRSRAYVKQVEPRSVELSKVVDEAGADLRDELARVDWAFESPPGADDSSKQLVWADPTISSMVVFTLLQNALDAVRGLTSPWIRLRASRVGSDITLRVEDNGPGVPPQLRDQLFTPGFTTKSGGLGSALAFARLRARQQHGDLWLDADHSPGAAFVLRLPCTPLSQRTQRPMP